MEHGLVRERMSECVSEIIKNIVIYRNLLQLFVTVDNTNWIFIVL